MMKTNLKKLIMVNLYIMLTMAISTSVSAQQKEQFQFNHKALYEVTYLSDSTDQQSQKQQMTELLLGEKTSLFRSSQKASNDSSYMDDITNKIIRMPEPTVVPAKIDAFNYQVLKDFTSGQTKVYDEYTGSSLNNLKDISYYLEPQEAMSEWTLSNDTSTINGQLCQSAEIEFGGRKWTAWFSPELSAYSDGPYKFKGLPGLIFRVHDAKKTWNFELVELSKIDTLVSINFKEGLIFHETTKEQLYKERRHYQKNQIEIKEAAGSNFGESRKDVKAKLEELIREDNNWIELYP